MKNSKLFIFQHGDGGIYADDNDSTILLGKKICDKYFVWGRIPRMDMKVFLHEKMFRENRQFLSSIRGKILLIMLVSMNNLIDR